MTAGVGVVRDTVRVAAVQWAFRGVGSADAFIQRCRYFVDVAADRRADFVVFPELFALEMLSAEPHMLTGRAALERLTALERELQPMWQRLAQDRGINILAGSTLVLDDEGRAVNKAGIFLRDGSVKGQIKIQPTPNEADVWRLRGGDELDAIMTDCGPVGVLICYDAEFPELPRRLADQGALLLLVPYCTDDRRGHLRVRTCCQARAIENQLYIATAGVTGNLAGVENLDQHYAQSAILTPSDMAFAWDGIAADTEPNVEMVAIADLRMSDLAMARSGGTVRNFTDRRTDLYRVEWGGAADTKR